MDCRMLSPCGHYRFGGGPCQGGGGSRPPPLPFPSLDFARRICYNSPVPIYEFLCPDCDTIFNFFSPVPNTEARPTCPKCARPDLRRRVSRFATLKHKGEEEPTPFGGLDETRMEKAMEALAGEMEGLEGGGGAEDPRAMARFMRRFTQMSGMEAGPKMEEMLRRLEAGEDPEAMEKEMGADDMTDEEAMSEFFKLKKAARGKKRKPKEDETLYFL